MIEMALGRQLAQGADQDLGLRLREHGGRLVQDEEAGLLAVDLAGDLGELLVADGHLGDEHVRVQLDAQLGDRVLGARAHVRPVQHAHAVPEHVVQGRALHGLAVQDDVLRRREAGNEAELLVRHADACIQRVERAVEVHFLAVDANLAFESSGLPDHGHPEQDAHEGGLARAVLSHQADDFPGLHIEAHIMQNDRPVEILGNVLQRKERCFLSHIFP